MAQGATGQPRTLIFGTGAIGTIYAYIIARAIGPDNVVAVCRSNYEAANRDGFTINSNLFGKEINVRPHIVRTVAEAVHDKKLGPFNHVVICAKALPSIPSIQEQIAPAVTEGATSIVLIQNGIKIEPEYATRFPQNPILSCVVYLPATVTAPAVVSHKEIEHLHIGTYPSNAPASHKEASVTFGDLIKAGGATATIHEDIQVERWSKLLVNASWNPICALSRNKDADFMASSTPSSSATSSHTSASETTTNSTVDTPTSETTSSTLTSDFAADYIRDVMLEIALIAQAAGYHQINTELVNYQIGRAKARARPGVEPSMLADARSGRRMEVDAIAGNALQIASEHGVGLEKTPLLRGLYALVKALDENFARQERQ